MTSTKLPELYRRRAVLARELASIDADIADAHEQASNDAPGSPTTWMKLKQFCETHELGESTVRRYIKEGMPHKLQGPRNIRINAPAADQWLEDRGIASRKRGNAA